MLCALLILYAETIQFSRRDLLCTVDGHCQESLGLHLNALYRYALDSSISISDIVLATPVHWQCQINYIIQHHNCHIV